ncbi:MAG: alpha/beta hydrolase [Candidatus Kerfeldbacteria bacterium]|jgi:carboxylesterase
MDDNKKKIGVLLIHGFTSFRASLEILIPELDKKNIPWHYPILAGHNTKPEDLEGKTWEHWQKDVEDGLNYLLPICEQIIIIGLSMGALLSLELAAKYPDKIKSLILLSPALKFKNPLAKYTSQVTKYIKKVPGINLFRFSTIKLAESQKGYSWFPLKTFHQYWLRTQHFDSVLEKIVQPTTIFHSKKDRLADPAGAEYIYNKIKAKDKQIIWLKKSGHEVLLDTETQEIVTKISSLINT